MEHGRRRSAAALPAVAAAGCAGAGGGVDDAEEQLGEHFLDPLTDAGITQHVQSTCRFGTPVDEVRHLQTDVRVQAPQQQVADVLSDAGVVVEPDSALRHAWQEGTQPGGRGSGPPFSGSGRYGWHGAISATP